MTRQLSDDVVSRITNDVDETTNTDLASPRVVNDKICIAEILDLRRTLETCFDAAVARPTASRKPRLYNFGRGCHHDNDCMGVSQPCRPDDCSRDIANDGAATLDIVIDRRRNPIMVAMRAPPQRKNAIRRGLSEVFIRHRLVLLRQRRRPRYDAAGKHDALIAPASGACAIN